MNMKCKSKIVTMRFENRCVNYVKIRKGSFNDATLESRIICHHILILVRFSIDESLPSKIHRSPSAGGLSSCPFQWR